MASTYLTRTFSSAGGGVYKWTYSFWIKRSGLGECTMTSAYYSNSFFGGIKFNSDDTLEVYDYRNSYLLQKITNRKFRDTNAWYHIVVANDNSVSSPDTKIYINGVEETSFSTNNEYSQNDTNSFNNDYGNAIGCFSGSSQQQFVDGSMSHFHYIDGTQYQASDFGETDSTTGEWKIKTSPSVTYGNNGFFILKDGNSVTDQSGNGNNWTVSGGTLTKTEDNPSNVFATMNSLDNYYFNGTFANGNNTVTTNASVESYITSTLAVSTGKYYWEIKISSSGSDRDFIGIGDRVSTNTNFTPYSGNSNMISYYGYTGESKSGSSTIGAYGATFTTGDIISVAMDLDNNKLYFAKNGTWQNSGDPTSGSTGTGALSIPASPQDGVWYAQFANIHNTASTFQANFGNGYFGTTAVSSAGTNASNIGIFEYDVPTGYTALSTKGLNE